MIYDDLVAGRLAIPFDLRLQLKQTYFLAWQRSALEKPLGMELRAWIIGLSRRQTALSRGPLPNVK
ncbi:transcriptional regulator [Pseudaminobacter soli (ex Zhang et al. 2022)]|uniref:transcriptional regulator n=1 Tax=Pseudaminobacter soli (ex Zhang et al. 2022) TaxID=2831468 RepID=UPI001F1BD1F8|nr:transcriptional regulator [Pseudaminobacter soli]